MREHTPKSVLVTGGAGFIGANLVHHLVRAHDDVQVVNLDLLTYAASLEHLAGLPDGRHHFVQGDIRDGQLVARLLREHRVDTVIHLAAESHVDRSITGPAQFIETNLVGTFTLLEQARKFWLDEKALGDRSVRFHHVSTDEVFGSLGPHDPPFHEDTPYQPNSPYSASKAGSDHLVRAYQHTYKLPTSTTNCSNNYGPFQHGEKFIPTVMRSCFEQKPIPVYGNGMNVRDWLFVEDHCRAIDLVVRQGQVGETYCVGGESEKNNLEIVRTLCAIFDELRPQNAPHEKLVTFVADRPGHDWRYAIDVSKIRRELGWSPSHRFEQALRKTVQRFLDGHARR